MGWFFRKSFRLIPGFRVSLSKSGPRLSVGVPGARASVDMRGKARIYGGKGALRYQKAITLGAPARKTPNMRRNLISIIRGIFRGP